MLWVFISTTLEREREKKRAEKKKIWHSMFCSEFTLGKPSVSGCNPAGNLSCAQARNIKIKNEQFGWKSGNQEKAAWCDSDCAETKATLAKLYDMRTMTLSTNILYGFRVISCRNVKKFTAENIVPPSSQETPMEATLHHSMISKTHVLSLLCWAGFF